MATALAGGMGEPVLVSDIDAARAQALAEATGGQALGSNREVAEQADAVMLCHKPAQLEDVALEIRGSAKVVISMLTLGVYKPVERRAVAPVDYDEMQKDLQLLAAIGSEDQRSLKTVAFSKQMPALDHYQVLDIPRAATGPRARPRILPSISQYLTPSAPSTTIGRYLASSGSR